MEKLNVNFGQRRKMVLKDCDVRFIDLLFQNTAAAVNVNCTTGVDLSLIDVSINATYHGIKETIYSGALWFIVAASMFGRQDIRYIDKAATIESPLDILLAHGAAVKKVAALKPFIDLQTIYNLRGTDQMEIEISLPATSLNAEWDSATSYLSIIPQDAVGIGSELVKFESWPLSQSSANFNQNLEDNVTDLILIPSAPANIQTNADMILSANAKIDNFRMISDRLSYVKTAYEIYQDCLSNLPKNVNAYGIVQILNEEVDDCRIYFDIKATTASLIVIKYLSTVEMVNEAERRNEKHQVKLIGKIK
jgi:hypothetical protein